MTDAVQIFMPENASVGDRAELHYMFHTESPLLQEEESHVELPLEIPALLAEQEKCKVLSATLDRFGSEYTLSLSLVGWKSGQIDFSPFTLKGYTIDLKPIEFHSIVEKTGAQGFRPASPPLVVPGTSAMLALFALLFLVVLSASLFALFHIPAIADFLTKSRAERIARRNMRTALKKLRGLSARGGGLDDKSFSASLQHILRDYLSKRFSFDFASVHTAALYDTVSCICGADLTSEQEGLVQEILSLFTRTDYIRYASAVLQTDERESLLASALHVVEELGGAHADL